MKKLVFILIFFGLLGNFIVFSLDNLKEINMYYSDIDGNNKIDNLEIEFNKSLSGTLNFDKLFLYSNTGGLSTSRLNSISGNNIFSGFYLSGNILGINLVEHDNFLTGIIVNNTTSSHLRLKTNAGVGIFDENGNEIKLLYTSSFDNYKNVFYKKSFKEKNISNEITNSGSTEETNTGTVTDSGSIEETNTGTVTDSGSTEETNTGTVTQSGMIENINYKSFLGKLIFQNPTYLSGKELELNEYTCLSSETDCKVNFNLNIDFGSGFTTISTLKYNCEWNFGIDDFLEEKYKCNPNTIIYPEGNFNINYKIWEISNPSNVFSKSFKIINNGYIKPSSEIKVIYKTETIVNNIVHNYIEDPKIIVQSGLDEENNCKKENCIINVSYEPKNSKEACLWTFIGGVFNVGDEKKCNPGYIKYPLGNFKIILRVYEIGNEGNYKESSISFKNEKNIKKESFEEINKSEEEVLILTGKTFTDYTLKISKILPNPIGNDDIEFIELENFGTGEVNLKGCELDDKINGSSKPFLIEKDIILSPKDKIKFFKFDTGINLNNTSGDEVNLICNNNLIDNLIWNFNTQENSLLDRDIIKENLEKIEEENKLEKFGLTYLVQSGIENDKINEIVNKKFTQKIQKSKSGIKIYGKTFPNIKVIIKLDKIEEISFLFPKVFAGENNIYETISDEKGSYEIILQNLNIGEFEIKTILSDEKNNLFKINKKLNFEVNDDYLEYINYLKEKNNKKNKNNNIIVEDLKSIITIQNIAKNIGIIGNKIVCKNVDECNINFDGRKSSGKIKTYFWDFGNGIFSNKSNPNSIKYVTGKYIVLLKVSDNIDESFSYFFIEVEGKLKNKGKLKVEKQKSQESQDKKIYSEISKIDIMPTALAYDEKNKDFKFHIFMSFLTFLLFLILSFIILKKEKII